MEYEKCICLKMAKQQQLGFLMSVLIYVLFFLTFYTNESQKDANDLFFLLFCYVWSFTSVRVKGLKCIAASL